ncbi:uncharacterized protein ARB_04438 [Trichophyton benhamiae CBS 112371]|uniref:Uncharacterized protein n=1 Tax=Arthroderma benhamiae (strain ATCC MYA-4681 / CBS 112371) TaxID=663331 RepID=D4AJI8_ARTBC|nr:uncharacterized protein ARB_04438 [Trichophyton benhamiae CBS 112371]EFE36911.1 hypothetical protein ARB_04438 [Trichophyton benhamiae CBS 112371]
MDYGYVSSLSGSWLGELDGWMDEERESDSPLEGCIWLDRHQHHAQCTYKQLVLVVSPGIGWTRPVSVDETLLQRCAAWQATPCMKSEVDECEVIVEQRIRKSKTGGGESPSASAVALAQLLDRNLVVDTPRVCSVHDVPAFPPPKKKTSSHNNRNGIMDVEE